VSEPRIRPEDLAELAALPPDDPRRRALDESPRAAALLRAYQEFVAPSGPLPPGADPEAAEAHLLAALERELGVPLGAEPAAAPAATPRGQARTIVDEPGRPFAWLWGPRARPAFALAAVTVAALAAWTLVGPRGREESPVLRGGGDTAAVTTAPAALAASPLDDGRVRLAWTATPGATEYAVVFLGADLSELARVEGLAHPELVLDPAALPAGLAPGREILWRVSARAGRDEIARSVTSPLSIPQ
jgi:hypothetical protein